MADLAQLRDMVMSFRVSELQVLLGFAGRNKSGRKQELLQRALALIHRGCNTPIQIKIKELYRGGPESESERRRYPGKTSSPPHPVHPPSIAGSSGLPGYVGYHNAGALDYKPSISDGPSNHPSNVPVHPDVSFKHLPFYDVLGELLKTSSLVPKGPSRFQETFFVFHMTPQQAQDISLSRDMRPGSRCEYAVQVQLRFCLLETSCEQEDNFPPSICVRVNGKMAPLPNPIPTNKPGVDPKRPSRPVNITSICRISPTIANHVNISWASEFGRSYCVAVFLVRRLSSDILLQRLKNSGVRHPDHTRALIKEKLAHDPDSEIATTSLRVSLLCPLGKMRMMIPSRSSTCTHLQCFDAITYLQMNEKKPSWTCPVCDRPAEFNKLTVDGLFTEILGQVTETLEIELLNDGSWQPMKPKETTDRNTSQIIQTIGDSPKKPEIDVIDLTETDDEEDTAVINTSTCSSDSSSSSDSSVVARTPPSNPDSEDVKILGSPSSTANCTSGAWSVTSTSGSLGMATSSVVPPPRTVTSSSSSSSGESEDESRHDKRSLSRLDHHHDRRLPYSSSFPAFSTDLGTSSMSARGDSSNLVSYPPYPTLPRYQAPPPPPLIPIPQRDMPPLHHPHDYFRNDAMDIGVLDLYSLLQDNEADHEFEYLGTVPPPGGRSGFMSSLADAPRRPYGSMSGTGSGTIPTPTFSISSNSSLSGNHGDRSSPECISLD